MKNVIIYDFDGTLTPYALPKFEILEKSGIKDGATNPEFMQMVIRKSRSKNIDLYDALYETYFEIIKNAGFKLTDDNFSLGHDKVVYNNGVIEFLDMLCKNGIDNYLLSSGLKVFLNKISISDFFVDIYATTFCYDESDEANGLNFLMSDKNKVEAIKSILKKRQINENDCSHIIYIGDGLTDYYAMKYVKSHGGTTIFVYSNLDSKEVLSMKEKDVVDFYTKSDFSKNSDLERYVKKICKI